ncbi:MAG: hypothetical protein VKP62_10240 [Candidatus Sericytochromatia bacterium]|nr:hypothetical protein [Candidatus Sericytochromatia bacterium]
MHRVATLFVGAALVAGLYGCGTTGRTSLNQPRQAAVAMGAKTAKAPSFDFTGISGDGRVGTNFYAYEGGGIEFKAIVSNPAGQPLTYAWSVPGGSLQYENVASVYFKRAGYETISCTVKDAAGQGVTRSVRVLVNAKPATPPPFPPNPFPPRP